MDIEKYLERIGLSLPLAPTRENLFKLQKAHLYAVPYENLDILRKKRLEYSKDALFDKIVTRRRGGYCFELNELFGHLLRALGYGVEDYFARFLRDEEEIPKRRHHVLKVSVPGEGNAYLCDVGVGTGSPTYPVAIVESEAQAQGDELFCFEKDPFLGWVLKEKKRGAWREIFSFTEEKQLTKDFDAISYFCEYAPESIFNKAEMIAMRMDGGRKTLDGDEFKRFFNGEVDVKVVRDADEKRELIKNWFGIVE